jgi:hypothetical protein
MIFDLDPAGDDFEDVRASALELRAWSTSWAGELRQNNRLVRSACGGAH